MNKSELITRMTERLGGDRAAAVAAVDGVLAEIEGGVARGERVSLTGFGTFERRERAARTGRNPRTGEAIQVGPSVVPVFRAGAGFRTLVGKGGTAAAARRGSRTVRVDVVAQAGSEGTRAEGEREDAKDEGKKGKGKKGKDKKGKDKKGKDKKDKDRDRKDRAKADKAAAKKDAKAAKKKAKSAR